MDIDQRFSIKNVTFLNANNVYSIWSNGPLPMWAYSAEDATDKSGLLSILLSLKFKSKP